MNPTTGEIYQKARELGALLASSAEFSAMKQAEADGRRDAALSSCVAEYISQRATLDELIGREDKDFTQIGALTRSLDDIQERMHALPASVAMKAAREAFNGLTRAVMGIIREQIGTDDACGGDCASCPGCGSGA